jgi:hypothetical protein
VSGSARDGRRAAATADAALLAHLEGYPARARRLLSREQVPFEPPRGDALSRFRLDTWQLRLAGEPREVERPPQLADDLQERTPQAILRDLHRPVRMIPPIKLRPVVVGADPGAGSARTRKAMVARYAVRMAQHRLAAAIGAEALAELRDLLAKPWEPALPEDEARRASLEPGPEDAHWFGTFGGVDPDQ